MKKKKKVGHAWAFIVSLSIVAATTVMAQQPAQLPEQTAVDAVSLLPMSLPR